MIPAPEISEPEVLLIESDRDFFAKSGPLPLHWDDVRQFPRFYLRSRADAVIFPLPCQSMHAPRSCQVLTGDISRGGMNLITSQQLFPSQRIDVRLARSESRTLKVVWCRRLREGCYSIGAQFVIQPT